MKNGTERPSANTRHCFVVMGFGTQTDYATGRKLDLNKSYRLLIKPVVERRGLTCVRADEIRHSGVIDAPMYQELLKADVIIADLSTSNSNAFYELGIRHALRPCTTIVISEDKLCYPFNLNHVSITSYSHLGDAIDYDEVLRFQKVLGDKLDAVLANQETDSPVYTFLDNLVPPALRNEVARATEKIGDVLERAKDSKPKETPGCKPDNEDQSLAGTIEQGEQAIRENKFYLAKTIFQTAISISNRCSGNNIGFTNSYLLHRLVLATYKARVPDELSALAEAKSILAPLNLENTNDPETLGLGGNIERLLYENGLGDGHLEIAIGYYERAFYLRNDRYNGIHLAFLLNCRACSSLDTTVEERIADIVWATRIRKKVLSLCDKYLHDMERRHKASVEIILPENDYLSCNRMTCETEERFWVLVNKAEVHLGLGEIGEYEKARTMAEATEHEEWMMATFTKQVNKLGRLLKKQEDLITVRLGRDLEFA